MSSLSTVFVPRSAPAAGASLQGMPAAQASGAKSQPKMRCRVSGSASGMRPRSALARYTSATSTMSIATIWISSPTPSTVPRVTASIALAS